MTATQSHSGQPSLWVHRLLQKATGLGFPSQSGHGFVSSWRGSSPAGRAWLGSGSDCAACGLLFPDFADGGGLPGSTEVASEAAASAEGAGGSPVAGAGSRAGKISAAETLPSLSGKSLYFSTNDQHSCTIP